MKTVVIDPGHGGTDPGANNSSGGPCEARLNLLIAEVVRDCLHGRVQTWMTRNQDVYVALATRAAMANEENAGLFVSIHCNSSENVEAHGYEVWTSKGQTRSDEAATIAFEAYGTAFPHLAARKNLGDGDPDKEANFAVLVRTIGPAYLFECGFLSHPTESRWIEANIISIGTVLAEAIARFLGVAAGSERKRVLYDLARARKILDDAIHELQL